MSLMTLAAARLTAQNIAVTGNVKNDKGNSLHYVFVSDNQAKNAVFTDSLGNFTITAKQGTKLQFQYAGYADTTIDINKSADLRVALRSLGGTTGSGGSLTAQKTISSQSKSLVTNADMGTLSSGGEIGGPAHKKGNLHGSRYLFEDFVHGFLINESDELIYNPAYLFDYDKIGGVLLITQDKNSVSEANVDRTKSFTLYSNTDGRFVFERVPAIDKAHYSQVLASGKKYNIYKTISTRFVKSDYVNNGITTHGNDYDEYVDDYVYYVLDVQGGQLQKFNPKKRALKTIFAKDADKLNKFLADNSGDIDDAYLSKLGDLMNQ